jgi:hypothetical protein
MDIGVGVGFWRDSLGNTADTAAGAIWWNSNGDYRPCVYTDSPIACGR